MCGLAGIISIDARSSSDLQSLTSKFCNSMRHRGPDDQGRWIDESGFVALAHTRLAILDTSSSGAQPRHSQCGRYVMVFNGEIYNHHQLRIELESLGVKLKGRSDTEVALEMFAKKGVEQTVRALRGMFAIGLVDRRERKLYLVRDRAGKKPLFVLKSERAVYFASEIKSLRSVFPGSLRFNEKALWHYLTFGYVPHPLTIYREIQSLESACVYTFDLPSLDCSISSYWELPHQSEQHMTFEEAVSGTESRLREAVALRMVADVPVGCFLSGGIDSGLMVAMAATQAGEPVRTFTVRQQESGFDEGAAAAEVARKFGTVHTAIVVPRGDTHVVQKALMAFDQPFADPSAVLAYWIAAEARKHVKVVLNGEGADEVFCGYRRYQVLKGLTQFHYARGLLRPLASAILALAPLPKTFRSSYAFAHRVVRGLSHDRAARYVDWCVDGFSDLEKSAIFQNFTSKDSTTELLNETSKSRMFSNELDCAIALDFKINLHDDMLVKMDMATMAHGLEARCPFLDHELIQWAFQIPMDLRCSMWTNKPVLRALARKYLPDTVANAKKRGFELPIIDWLEGPLKDFAADVLLRSTGFVSTLFKRAALERLLQGRDMEPDRWSRRVWNLLALEIWSKSAI